MINTPALLMSSGSKLKKESDISLTVGQSSGYSMVRNGRAYPLTFYGYSSGELPISLLNTEASVSIVVATDAVSVFGSAPELEKLGIKGLFPQVLLSERKLIRGFTSAKILLFGKRVMRA